MSIPFRMLRRLAAGLCATIVPVLVFAQPRTLTILHTNDMHAGFQPHDAMWVKETPRPRVGGFQELWYISDSVKRANPPFIMLDAGDVMTGNPITDMIYAGASGGALIEMMNRIGYDAWTPGNHDFDISQENLRALIRIAGFPTVCANLVNADNAFPVGNLPYALIERGGMRIGIIGIISQELYSLVFQNNLVNIKVLSPAEVIQDYVDQLRPHTDLLIALTHQGAMEDSILATKVSGLNIIVGGHSHTRLKKPKIVNEVLIVQTGSSVENLGVLTVTVENHRVTAFDGKLITLWAGRKRPASPISLLADSLQREIDREYNEVLATLKDDWVRRDGQSGIGTFIAEAQREAGSADVGFMNNYGIRRDVPAGALTKKALFEVLPFRNMLTTFQLSGRQLREIMKYNIEKKPAIQIAGMSGRWRGRADGSAEFTSIEVGGRPLDENRMYVCAASDYFVGEAKRYLGLEIQNPLYSRQTVFSAVEAAVRRAKELTGQVRYAIEKTE